MQHMKGIDKSHGILNTEVVLKPVVGESHSQSILLFVNFVSHYLVLLFNQFDQFTTGDDRIGYWTVSRSYSLELSRKIVGQAKGLFVNVTIFTVAKSTLSKNYNFPLGSKSSSLAVRVGRMIW
jgi:hypothetical protein